MSDAPPDPRAQQREFLTDCLHLFAATMFAVPGPLLGMLAQNAEFFVARRDDTTDLVSLVAVLCLALPGALAAVEAVAFRWGGRRIRRGLHLVFMAALLSAVTLQALHAVHLPGVLLVGLSAGAGVLLTLGYRRFNSVRSFLSVLALGAVAVPLHFLFLSPVAELLIAGDRGDSYPDGIKSRTPVAVIVVDECPLTSLLNIAHRIDATRFPNLAHLSREAVWYRNATTVSDSTVNAVPAILSGTYPRAGRLPIAADHPRNLFSLLASYYDLQVMETVTGLCPKARLSSSPSTQVALEHAFPTLLWDVSMVYLHLLLPPDLATWVPDITNDWKDFGAFVGANPSNDRDPAHFLPRSQNFRYFVRQLHRTPRPELIFVHSVLPHVPWRFLPSGRAYAADDAPTLYGLEPSGSWTPDLSPRVHACQRHLCQAAFVDRLVGEAIGQLKALHLYDDCLLVVVADHGVAFSGGAPRRRLTASNAAEILPVPLLIKYPHQQRGRIEDRNAETIDILPTIADVLGIRLFWPLEGHSLVGHDTHPRPHKVCYDRDDQPHVFGSALDAKYRIVGRNQLWFPDPGTAGLFRCGPHCDLVGCAVGRQDRAPDVAMHCQIAQADDLESVEPRGLFIPAWIRGELRGADPDVDNLTLAVAVNGIVRATTRPFKGPNGHLAFASLVEESAFRAGANHVDVFAVLVDAGKIRLARLPQEGNS